MTKILLRSNRIIFDGHADSIQECETITLLCDSLSNSQNFKTVRYESGYAEFEKVGKAEKLMFPPEAGVSADITVNGSAVHISGTLLPSETTATWLNVNQTTPQYSIENDKVIWLSNGEILQHNVVDVLPDDEIIGDGVYTTRAATSQKSYDISTSSKWSALSDGEHTVQIVAKGTGYRDSAKSTSVTVMKGGSTGETWILNYSIQPGSQSYNFTGISFTSNNQNFDRLYYNRQSVDVGTLSYSLNGTEKEVYSFDDYSDIWLDGEAYRIITFETAPTGDLLTWLQANGTKQ